VLVLLIGRATRLAQFLSGLEKEYEAVIRLGFATDTGDVTGKPLISPDSSKSVLNFSESEIEAAFAGLRGEIDQVPPMYSAKKQQGRKLYELARRGEEVERQPVRVSIQAFESLTPNGELRKANPDGTFDLYTRIVCSAGTYIRTLAEDFGKRLGVGAHVAELRRTRVGGFNVGCASTLGELQESIAEESLGQILLTPDAALAHLPGIDLKDAEVLKARNGVGVAVEELTCTDGERVKLRDEHGQLVAVATFEAEKNILRPQVVLAHHEV
jgi:tRNA pseudouridine55 synthase